MKKIIHYNPDEAGKLHCDECGYDLPNKQPFIADLIGTPCPKCGADMLTASDYKKTRRVFNIIDFMNKCFGWLFGTENPPTDVPHYEVSVRMNGPDADIKVEKREATP